MVGYGNYHNFRINKYIMLHLCYVIFVCIAFFSLWWRRFNQKEERKNALYNLKAQTNTTNILL